MSRPYPLDPDLARELALGIVDTLTGNVISERESLADCGVEPVSDDGEDVDLDWTPARHGSS